MDKSSVIITFTFALYIFIFHFHGEYQYLDSFVNWNEEREDSRSSENVHFILRFNQLGKFTGTRPIEPIQCHPNSRNSNTFQLIILGWKLSHVVFSNVS